MNSLKKIIIVALLISSIIINQISLANIYYFEDANNTSTNKTLLYGGLAIGAAGALAAVVASLLIHSSNDDSKDNKRIGSPNIEVNAIHFYEPGINGRKNLTIENLSPEKVSINSITFGDGVKNNINIVNNYCHSALAAGKSCNIILEAKQTAYNGTVTIDYGYDNRQITRKITIEKSSLKLYETTDGEHTEILPNQEIRVKEEESTKTQTFQWKNNGKFNWQKPYIKWEGSNPAGFELDVDTCGSETDPGNHVAPGKYCQFKITLNNATIGTKGKLDTGCQLNSLDMPYEKNVIMRDGIVIVKNTDSNDYHLAYRSVKVINPTGQSIKLNALEISIDGTVVTETSPRVDKITYCPYNSPTTNPCFEAYRTGSKCRAGETLDPDEECKIWFKAEPLNNSDQLYHSENIPIQISVKPNIGESKKINLLADTDQALYIGGEFSFNNHVTKWNGDDWVAFNTGTNDNVYAIELREDSSDIFVGGKFESPGPRAVIWNGNNWKTLSNNLTDGSVSDFLYHDNGSNKLIYVAGSFTSPFNRIFKCGIDNSCSSLSQPLAFTGDDAIYTMHFKNKTEMFIGGRFSSGNNVKLYKTDTAVWSNLDNGVDGNILAISNPVDAATITTNGTYFGGSFNHASGGDYPAFAVWKKIYAPLPWQQEWGTTQNSPGFSTSDTVRTMKKLTFASNLSYVYVGGNLSNTGNIIRIRSDNGSWYGLGGGTNAGVYTITTLGNKYVFIGGDFTSPGHRIAIWDEERNEWSTIDNLDITESDKSINGIVRDSAIARSLKIRYNDT